MIKVRDFVEKNENMPITIEAAMNEDLCNPMREEVYAGMLHDIPEHLMEVEVLEARWLIGARRHLLTVRKDDVRDEGI